MITLLKLSGIALLILVGYHFINESLGFSVSQAIALLAFAGCLVGLYRGYRPSPKNWVGWGLIAFACLMLAGFSSWSWLLLIPLVSFITGYRFAELPFDLTGTSGGDYGSDGGAGSFSDGGSCDGGGGD